MKKITIVVILAVTLIWACRFSLNARSTEIPDISEFPITRLESLIPGDGSGALERVDRLVGLGGSHEYMLIFRTTSEMSAKRFVYQYTNGFLGLLADTNASRNGLGTDRDDISETASVFNATYSRSGQDGIIDVFMYQGIDEKFYVRIRFFETR